MKITLAIPENKKHMNEFIQKELNSAKNIKSKETRDSVIEGLTKIKQQLQTGKVFLWGGKELVIYDYPLHQFVYECGKKFVVPADVQKGYYILLTMDANEATIGRLWGKKIETLWTQQSNVPRKHNKGGQSKERFQREREGALKKWFKKVAFKLREVVE